MPVLIILVIAVAYFLNNLSRYGISLSPVIGLFLSLIAIIVVALATIGDRL